MKIQLKTLQQKVFTVDVQPSETVCDDTLPEATSKLTRLVMVLQVLDIKKKVQDSQSFTIDSQKLIFSGEHAHSPVCCHVGSRELTLAKRIIGVAQARFSPMTRRSNRSTSRKGKTSWSSWSARCVQANAQLQDDGTETL